MGRSIVYCGDCGTCLRERDFGNGAAREIDLRPFCARCRPPAAALPKTASRASTGRVPRIGTTRRPAPRPASRTPVVAAVVLLAALILGAVVLASTPVRRDPKPAPPAEAREHETPGRLTFGGPGARTR